MRKLSLAMIVLVAVAVGATAPSRGEGGERRIALVIGLNDYMEQVSPLRCAVNDAREVKRTLVECAGFSPDDVLVMTTSDRANGLPTNANIKQCLQQLKSRLTPRDTLVFFFSGHGVEMDEESYLLTFEANPYSAEALKASCLPISTLRAELAQMHAGHTLLFLDACRQDPRVKPSPGPQMYDADAAQAAPRGDERANARTRSFAKALVVLGPGGEPGTSAATSSDPPLKGHAASFFSCDLGQRSYEWPEMQMGFFTYYLVNGLREAAADTQGQVTIPSLESFLASNVSSAVETRFKMRQTPTLNHINASLATNWALRSRTATSASPRPSPSASPALPAAVRKREPGKRLTYALDIVSNNVEARDYNVLTHRIEEHFYEIDRDELRKRVAALLDATDELVPAPAGTQADVWIYFNVCPTKNMMIDLLARDAESSRVVLRQNEELYRPYPGNTRQLVDVPVGVLKSKMLTNLKTALKRAYAP